MDLLIAQIDLKILLLITFGLVLWLLIILLARLPVRSAAGQRGEEIKNEIARLKDAQSNLHCFVEDKMMAHQQAVYNVIMEDREKQLVAIGELRVDLEKRFSESGLALINNINEFESKLTEKFDELSRTTAAALSHGEKQLATSFNHFIEKVMLSTHKSQSEIKETIGKSFRQGGRDLGNVLDRSIKQQNESIKASLGSLTETTDKRLQEISGEVDKRLTAGFDKTTQTFSDVLKRLALIDDAQQKITELSGSVISLQEILNDKRSRGAFGEIQLQALMSNIMPETHYSMQYKFSTGKVADCILQLPEPTGRVAIDAKFPLESYKKMMDIALAQGDRRDARRQFVKDIKKHINDIADKYIIPHETSDGAVMFIPAESVFAEIHGHYPELIEYSYQKKVWLVSPTTLMAVLTTAATVIKDEQTRKQVHIIKNHLTALGQDFLRFKNRMDNLSKHIGLVTKDVEQVSVSARKISSRFDKIERVDIDNEVEREVLKVAKVIEP